MSRDAIAGGGGEREPPRIVVVGGGIAGLTAAFRLSQRLPDADIVLLEREARLGGKIVTERRDGFVIEGGPEAMLVAKPQAQALCRDLELEDRLLEPNSAARGSSVLRGGRLIPLPDGLSGVVPTKLRPIAASPLIPPLGKLRMGFDFVLPQRRDEADEALAAFVERRLGRDAYRWLVEPLVGGIYAGDGARLSLAATFPQLRQMERDSGGLIRGALAARKAAPAPPPGPRPSPFRAPRGGLGELVESLAARLQAAGVRVETNATVEAIVATPNSGFVVSRASGEALRADAVVCAAPAPVAAGLLSELDPALAKGLGAIPYASVANVSLAYPLTALPRPLVGSGYLAPRAERRPINAGTWSSAKWAGRAPEGFALLRVSFGGVGRTGVLEASDERLVEIARDELRTLLGVAKPPRFTRVFRWPTAMPQYELGHLRRVAAIETCLADHPGLALAGNALHGVGLADCVGTGDGAAARIAEFLAKHDDAANG